MHGDEALVSLHFQLLGTMLTTFPMQKLALSVGCGGIEVDTWLGPSKESVLAASDGSDVTTNEDMVLYAGHDMEDIAKGRTLQKLYLDPIMERLNRHNKGCEGDDWVGLYQADPRAEVMIAIDMVSLSSLLTLDADVHAETRRSRNLDSSRRPASTLP